MRGGGNMMVGRGLRMDAHDNIGRMGEAMT